MPQFLALGVTEEHFWDSTPVDLEPYIEAEKIRQKNNDQLLWQNGLYTLKALSVMVSGLSKNNKDEYFKKPILQELEEQNKPLTEEEKQKITEQLFRNLRIMQNNFENSKDVGDE